MKYYLSNIPNVASFTANRWDRPNAATSHGQYLLFAIPLPSARPQLASRAPVQLPALRLHRSPGQCPPLPPRPLTLRPRQVNLSPPKMHRRLRNSTELTQPASPHLTSLLRRSGGAVPAGHKHQHPRFPPHRQDFPRNSPRDCHPEAQLHRNPSLRPRPSRHAPTLQAAPCGRIKAQ